MLKDKLKELRNSRGWSQAEVAEQLAIDQSDYSRIESGKIQPDINKLIKLAELYKVDFNELLNNGGVNNVYNNGENAVNNTYGYINTLQIESENKILKEENAFLKAQIKELMAILKKK